MVMLMDILPMLEAGSDRLMPAVDRNNLDGFIFRELSFSLRFMRLIDVLISNNFTPVVVGGAVRDIVLGIDSKDVDVEVHGCNSIDDLIRCLRWSGFGVDLVGKAFGVLKVDVDGEVFDVSLPRRDSKVGVGHRGFSVVVDANMSMEDAFRRRDFTINAIGFNMRTREVVDFFGGVDDLFSGVIRHVDDNTFGDDPLRILRAMQFQARFGFDIHTDTIAIMNSVSDGLKDIPAERIHMELDKLLRKGRFPHLIFDFVKKVHFADVLGLLKLDGVQQDHKWHMEGDAFVHSKMVTHSASVVADTFGLSGDDRVVLILSAILHDIGKPMTTCRINGLWRSPGHDTLGADMTRDLLTALRFPKDIIRKVVFNVRWHMFHTNFTNADNQRMQKLVRRLSIRAKDNHSDVKSLLMLMLSDILGMRPLRKDIAQRILDSFDMIPKGSVRLITGKDVMKALKLKEGGPIVGKVLRFIHDNCTTRDEAMNMLDRIASGEIDI